jgi:hypothetical protein
MAKILRIPDEARFVSAFALVVDPGDTLSLLLEIGALGSKDLSLVRHTREALEPAYGHASDRQDWDQTHTISVLQQALGQPDSAAYLAYYTKELRQAHTVEEFARALAVVGCAADTFTSSYPSGGSGSGSCSAKRSCQATPCPNPRPPRPHQTPVATVLNQAVQGPSLTTTLLGVPLGCPARNRRYGARREIRDRLCALLHRPRPP